MRLATSLFRAFAYLLLWVADAAVKMAVGILLVYLVWLIFHLTGDSKFRGGWLLAGTIVGACINGFFENCILLFPTMARRLRGDG